MGNHSEILKVGTAAILAGGKHIHNLFGKAMGEIGMEYKLDEGDTPRTLIDTYSEKDILFVLQGSKFRDDSLNPEESQETSGKTGRVWHIDPYDGTSNAQIKGPWSTSGLAVQEGEDLVAGVVLHPFENKLYFASKGEGAYVCDVKFVDGEYQISSEPELITVSRRSAHKELYVYTDSLLNGKTIPRKMPWTADIGALAMNHRSTGSNIDYGTKLAEGRADIVLTDAIGGYFDVAPGFVIVTEALGFLGNLEGKQPTRKDQVVVGANSKELFEKVLEITNNHYGPDSKLGMYQEFR